MKRALYLTMAMIALLSTVSGAQSLGDVAKKTEEQREAAKKADEKKASETGTKTPEKKVYTNKDLTDVSRTFAADDATSGTGAPSATVTTPAAPTTQTESARSAEYQQIAKKDEAYWKDRMRSLHVKLDEDQTFLDAAVTRETALDKRLHRNVDDILYIGDRLLRAEVDGQWQQAVAEVSRLKAAVANDTRAIPMAEEEARVAGVPPGWLRYP